MDGAQLSTALASDDPATGFRAVLALRRLAERVEANQVAAARVQGWSCNRSGTPWGLPASRCTPSTGSERSLMGESSTGFGMGRVYLDAAAEARRRGDRRVSTEHVALAMLSDAGSVTAQALGVSLVSARAALHDLDRGALATLGIEASFDGPVLPGRPNERLRLTPSARLSSPGCGTRPTVKGSASGTSFSRSFAGNRPTRRRSCSTRSASTAATCVIGLRNTWRSSRLAGDPGPVSRRVRANGGQAPRIRPHFPSSEGIHGSFRSRTARSPVECGETWVTRRAEVAVSFSGYSAA